MQRIWNNIEMDLKDVGEKDVNYVVHLSGVAQGPVADSCVYRTFRFHTGQVVS